LRQKNGGILTKRLPAPRRPLQREKPGKSVRRTVQFVYQWPIQEPPGGQHPLRE